MSEEKCPRCGGEMPEKKKIPERLKKYVSEELKEKELCRTCYHGLFNILWFEEEK